MEPVKRLTKRNILSYGCGNLGWNFVNFLTNFGMLFMTDYMGMNAGIIASLIAVSKVLDGFTDVLAGTIIDRTKSKLGKARVWVLRMAPLMAAAAILFFANPAGASDAVKYVWFFISYTLYNDVFYTLYYVADNTMMLTMTDNSQERVSLSIVQQMGNVLSSVFISASYLLMINHFGGGVAGWRIVSGIYAVIFVLLQIVFVSGTKEMPSAMVEGASEQGVWKDLIANISNLLKNKYFVIQFAIFLLYTGSTILYGTIVPYYCMRVLGDADNSRGTQTLLTLCASGVVLGLFFAPLLIKKLGIYKSNLYTRILTCFVYLGVLYGVYSGRFTVILIFELLFFICQGPYLGALGALIGKIAEYSQIKNKADITATISSCNTMGTKIGAALGSALVGALLSTVSYDGTLAVQPPEVLSMITSIFALVPLIAQIVITILLAFLNVEKAIEKEQQNQTVDS